MKSLTNDCCPYFWDEPLCKKTLWMDHVNDYCQHKFWKCKDYKAMRKQYKKPKDNELEAGLKYYDELIDGGNVE